MSFFSVVANGQQQKTLNLMPVPKTLNLKGVDFLLSPDFTIGIYTKKADTILVKAANRSYCCYCCITGRASASR